MGLSLGFDSWVFKKTFRYALWREKANMQMPHRELFSRTFGINEGQNLPEAQLVSQVLLERLATGAHRHKTSEIGHCRGYEAS